jgi:hypothetical protein
MFRKFNSFWRFWGPRRAFGLYCGVASGWVRSVIPVGRLRNFHSWAHPYVLQVLEVRILDFCKAPFACVVWQSFRPRLVVAHSASVSCRFCPLWFCTRLVLPLMGQEIKFERHYDRVVSFSNFSGWCNLNWMNMYQVGGHLYRSSTFGTVYFLGGVSWSKMSNYAI